MAGQTIQISVLADTKQFSKAFKNLSQQTGLSKLASGFKTLGKVAAVGLAAGAAGAVVIGKKLIDAGEAASTANARIANIAQSMGLFGDQAGAVAKRLQDLAGATARQTGMDTNSIKATQAKLLTFKELAATADVVGGAFDRANMAALDMAAAGFGDAESNAVQLGKALNDPIKGITALSRSGVTFTETEKGMIEAMVEAGDMAGAQNMILSALETQVGGTAAATANATDRMKVAWTQVQENLGQKLLPVLDKVSAWVVDVGLPAFERFASAAGDRLGPVLASLGTWIRDTLVPAVKDLATWIGENVVPALQAFGGYITGTVVPALVAFGGFLAQNRDVLTALAVVVGTMIVGIQAYVKVMAIWKAATAAATAVQVLFSAALSANPIGIVILAIAALVAGLVFFFTKTDTGRKIVEKAWGGIKTAMKAVTDWWSGSALPALSNGWNAITGFFSSGVAKVKGFLNGALQVIKTVWSFSPLGLVTSNFGAVLGFLRGIPGAVRGALSGAGEWLVSVGGQIIQGLVRGLTRALDTVKNAARKIANAVTGPVKKLLGIASPSKVLAQYGRWTTQGAAKGLADPRELNRVRASMKRVSGVITGGYEPSLSAAKFDSNVNARGHVGAGNTYNVNVSTLVPTAETGRVIAKSIQEYERMNGVRR